MALPASGTITLNDVHVELGATSGTAVSLGDSDVRSLAGISSGQISLANLHGKSALDDYPETFSGGTYNDQNINSWVYLEYTVSGVTPGVNIPISASSTNVDLWNDTRAVDNYVRNGDLLLISLKTPSSYGGWYQYTVTIGSKTVTYDVRTLAEAPVSWAIPTTINISKVGYSSIEDAKFVLRTDKTWDAYGSPNDLDNPVFASGSHGIFYKVIGRASTVAGPNPTSYTLLTTSDITWYVRSTGTLRVGTITLSLATSSGGANARTITINMDAIAENL